jgi:hypothetical protein
MVTQHPYRAALLALTLVLLGVGGIVAAQNGGDGGSFEVGGIDVDVVGKTSQAARLAGWRIAQRKGWEQLAKRYGRSGGLSDSALDSVVSGIVVEDEKIGGNRYIARLGIEFSRARAASILGIAGAEARSAPMLLIPVMWSGGVGQVFEQRTPWQEAWARFRTGNSTIDYVRPSGTGPDALIMNTGQILRPGRTWWRNVLGQYGATNVLIPIVHLRRQWPGGPVIGDFQARYGPDNRLLGRFSLRVADSDGLPALLDAGIKRIDDLYERALGAGLFKGDPGLNYRAPAATPVEDAIDGNSIAEAAPVEERGTSITVQVETMTSGSLTAAEASIRGVPGVRSIVTTSLALGAISVMRVSYDGDPAALAAGLEARGWQVTRGAGAIRIQRASGPAPAADDKTGG